MEIISKSYLLLSSTPQGMLFLQMLGSFAEFERAIINERTRNGRIARLNENKWVGGKPSLGYKVNEHGQFEIDEKEATIVKDIFKLRSKGLSLAKIGDKYGFSKQKVDYILKNKNYIGVFEYQEKKEKNDIILEIKPIISKYMWNKVNTNK
ncbi:MAG: recombinase family protein [Paraclostridium sp.]